MRKVFSSFDKNNSGYIDIQELRDVSKELGAELDQAELEECLKDLDVNKDNKVTYDEFKKWWLSGR
jgi:calcium-dependent protein kinase